MTRVGSLLRLSSKKQVARQGGDEQDIPGQRESIARFLETKPDWQLAREYVEAGVSAYKKRRGERDVLQDVLRDAENGVYDVLLVWKGDRLSRRIQDLPGIVADLLDLGVAVWSVADAPGGKVWNARSAMDLFLLSLEGFKNQSESEGISVRTKERKRQMRAAGQWTGGHVPFGYQLTSKKDDRGEPVLMGGRMVRELTPHPEQAPLVQTLYERYSAGTGYLGLTKWLNETAVPTRNGGPWMTATVRQILRNTFYAGYGSSRTYRQDPPVRAEHHAIIAEELWHKVHLMRDARASLPRRQQNADYVLTGILRCGVCGHTVGGTWFKSGGAIRPDGTKRQVYEYQIYRCLGFRRGTRCGNRNHRLEEVEEAFITALEQQLTTPTRLRTFLEQRAEADQAAIEADEAVRKQARKRLQEVEGALKRLDRAYLEAGTIGDEEYRTKKVGYQDERRQLEGDLARPATRGEAKDMSALVDVAKRIRRVWGKLSPEERKALALNLVKAWNLKVLLYPDKRVDIIAQ